MAAKKSTATSKKDQIINGYMTYVLEHEKIPASVYKFCKSIKVTEEQFYTHFGSIETLQKRIWDTFFMNTKELMEKNKEYDSSSNKDKMLTFFFTFFELLTLNRSYVLFTLDQQGPMLKKMEQLKSLRKHIKAFAADLIEDGNESKSYKISKHNPALFSEGAWLQFLFLLQFWCDDSSPSFEKTDIAIEKSVQTIFDVFDNTPLDSILDFGKFLYKENMA
ncbi:MAG: TetR/AcrR family transcriptional regulator [Eudoraea sp.]|nr:TetR/AcrR family transcriptional regulator [Eudoraea sp.]